jgi:type IV pilus assembly protein PilP
VNARKLFLGSALAIAATLSALAGCGGGGNDEIKSTMAPGAASSAGAGSPAAADGGVAPSPTAGMPPLPKRDFQERDFAESDQSRDPFRGFQADLIQQTKQRFTVQRKVLVDRYALEELKLVGLINGVPSRALLIDPSGLGWNAKVGDFVGKPEIVHSGGPTGADVPINWRVDRIRQGDVVFIREDPAHPEIPPTTRVIALRTVDEKGAVKGTGVTPTEGQPQ